MRGTECGGSGCGPGEPEAQVDHSLQDARSRLDEQPSQAQVVVGGSRAGRHELQVVPEMSIDIVTDAGCFCRAVPAAEIVPTDIPVAPPGSPVFSTSTTPAPRSEAERAADSPAPPPPATKTSQVSLAGERCTWTTWLALPNATGNGGWRMSRRCNAGSLRHPSKRRRHHSAIRTDRPRSWRPRRS